MNLILFGPPGAGKGTQASKLASNFKLKQVSTGDLLRNEIKFNKELGIEIESTINQGHLAPDKIVNSLLGSGPQAISQAKILHQYLCENSYVSDIS